MVLTLGPLSPPAPGGPGGPFKPCQTKQNHGFIYTDDKHIKSIYILKQDKTSKEETLCL